MNTIREKYQRHQDEWAILSRPTPTTGRSEGLVSRSCQPDPRVTLILDDPRVGRVAYWGGNHQAKVRAIVLVDGVEESLLLEDWTGYPWIRVAPDARLAPKGYPWVRESLNAPPREET